MAERCYEFDKTGDLIKEIRALDNRMKILMEGNDLSVVETEKITAQVKAISAELFLRDQENQDEMMGKLRERTAEFREVNLRTTVDFMAIVWDRGWWKRRSFEGLPTRTYEDFIDYLTDPTPWGLNMVESFAEPLMNEARLRRKFEGVEHKINNK